MIKCKKCKSRMFVDRQFNRLDHLEVYCIHCGTRVFYNPPTASEEGRWLLQKEKLRAKSTISPM